MTSVKIYGLDVPVLRRKNLTQETGFLGYFDPEKNEIVIDANLKGMDFLSTLVHEIIHAVFTRGGLRQAKISPSLEEIICEQISVVLTENFSLHKKRKR